MKVTVYRSILDPEIAKVRNCPLTNWVMMGLNVNGTFNLEDGYFARQFASAEEAKPAINEVIKERIQSRNASDWFVWFHVKTNVDFGDGTLGWFTFLDDGIVRENILHRIVIWESEYYHYYKNVCYGQYLGMLSLMCIAGILDLIGKRCKLISPTLILRLSVIGLWIFLMMWEASARYSSNYIMIFLLIAAESSSTIRDTIYGKC